MHLELYNSTFDYLCTLLPKAAQLLELGCGPSNITRYLLNKRPDLNIVATDIAPNMVQLARKNNPAADCRVLDCRQLCQEGAGRYQALVCGFCIPYLSEKDCDKLLADSYRGLSGEGVLYLSFAPGAGEKSGYLTSSSGLRTYFHYYSIKDIRNMLTQHSFQILAENNFLFSRNGQDEQHYVVFAQKRKK